MKTIRAAWEDTMRGSLILVTPDCALLESGRPKELLSVCKSRTDIRMEKEAAGMLLRLLERIENNDRIVSVSGFRSHEEQVQIWEDTLLKEGEAFTRTYVAKPGHSEHESGLAIDLAENRTEIDFIRPDFPREGICMEFRRQAAGYGFVERYPADKTSVTGIGEEPWHFRYVGQPHGVAMEREGVVLEEYIAFLKEETSQRVPYLCFEMDSNVCSEIFYVDMRGKEKICLSCSDKADMRISGTNEGGIVVCRRRAVYGEK